MRLESLMYWYWDGQDKNTLRSSHSVDASLLELNSQCIALRVNPRLFLSNVLHSWSSSRLSAHEKKDCYHYSNQFRSFSHSSKCSNELNCSELKGKRAIKQRASRRDGIKVFDSRRRRRRIQTAIKSANFPPLCFPFEIHLDISLFTIGRSSYWRSRCYLVFYYEKMEILFPNIDRRSMKCSQARALIISCFYCERKFELSAISLQLENCVFISFHTKPSHSELKSSKAQQPECKARWLCDLIPSSLELLRLHKFHLKIFSLSATLRLLC